jgi:hypothetical protein
MASWNLGLVEGIRIKAEYIFRSTQRGIRLRDQRWTASRGRAAISANVRELGDWGFLGGLCCKVELGFRRGFLADDRP